MTLRHECDYHLHPHNSCNLVAMNKNSRAESRILWYGVARHINGLGEKLGGKVYARNAIISARIILIGESMLWVRVIM